MNYQKTYMNHIHSSSLLCQLATMWKSQTLCDAIIRSGNNITRAHRVVLVAACPMLQSMENAASGSHLEVRVASDIKVESIHTFLQYLYEGFMTLTEENCKDVEKIARLLQVDGVVKCCADFHKCLNTSSAGQYKYSLLDQIEFRHVRTTDLSKCQDKMQKRQLDTGRMSPGGKRQKVHRPSSPPTDHSMSQRMSDMHSMSESYMPDANDPWDRVPRLGASGARSGSQPGVIDIVEDSLELIQTDPPGKHPGENSFDTRRVQQTVGISVASQHNKGADLQIVNVAEQQAMSSAARPPSDIIPSSPSSSSSSSFKDAMGSSRPPDPRGATGPPPPPQLQRMDPGRQPSHGTINLVDIPHSPDPEISKQASRQQGRSSETFPPSSMSSAPPRSGDNFQSSSTPQRPSQPFPVSLTAVPRGGPSFQSKPYAAGSAVQAEASSPRGPRSQNRGDADRASPAERAKDTGPKSASDMPEGAPDISIVKVERTSSNLAGDTVGGLDMFVSEGGVSLTPVPGVGQGEDDEHSDFELEEPPGEMSKEIDLSNMSNEGGDQSGNWYMGNMKDLGANILMETPMTGITSGRPRPGIWNPEEAFKFGMRELAPGSSVYVYEDEYICALSKIKLSEKTNRKDGTPAARYLLSVFYTSSELVNATIRNDGDDPTKPQGPYVPLNKTIIYAIEDKDNKTKPEVIIEVKQEFPDDEIVTVSWSQPQSGRPETDKKGDNSKSKVEVENHSKEQSSQQRKNNADPDSADIQRNLPKVVTELTSKQPTLHSCQECYQVFEDSTELRLHMNNIHNMDTTFVVVCEYCDKKFKTTTGYIMHRDRYHQNAEKYPKCEKCGKSFASLSSLETHMITHTRKKAYKCNICNKSYKFKGTLKAHKCEK